MTKMYSQSYSKIVSDSVIEELIAWDIDNSERYSEDQKIWKKRIRTRKISWEEAMISISTWNQLVSFEDQLSHMISSEKHFFEGDYDSLKLIPELFNESDIEYMKSQFENEINTNWDFKCRKGKLKDNPKINFYSFSNPLFDKTHTTAIIYKQFYCGIVCAHGTLTIYIREGTKWKLYKSFPLWIS